jgi:hypothetical protein
MLNMGEVKNPGEPIIIVNMYNWKRKREKRNETKLEESFFLSLFRFTLPFSWLSRSFIFGARSLVALFLALRFVKFAIFGGDFNLIKREMYFSLLMSNIVRCIGLRAKKVAVSFVYNNNNELWDYESLDIMET